MSEAERLSYDRGWNDALDKAELMLRRHFEKLWPHDQNCAAVLDEIRIKPLAAAPADGRVFHAFTCPQCGGHTWGTNTSAPKEADWTVRCHSDGCTFTGLYNNHISNAAAPQKENTP